jgi:hypothetical protein
MQILEPAAKWPFSRIFHNSARGRKARAGLGTPGGVPRVVTAVSLENYPLYPHLSTAIHRKKKKQKERGPADEGHFYLDELPDISTLP